jgi:hypothetical protein
MDSDFSGQPYFGLLWLLLQHLISSSSFVFLLPFAPVTPVSFLPRHTYSFSLPLPFSQPALSRLKLRCCFLCFYWFSVNSLTDNGHPPTGSVTVLYWLELTYITSDFPCTVCSCWFLVWLSLWPWWSRQEVPLNCRDFFKLRGIRYNPEDEVLHSHHYKNLNPDMDIKDFLQG